MFSFFRRFKRPISLLMLLQMMGTILPTQSLLALTSGPGHPDVSGYQSADVNDNVSLSTGAFNYNIPITSIPEYPMSIGYNNGMNPDQEASAFGFGFNGFSGAVTRDMVGLPDDVREGETQYKFKNEGLWGITTSGSASVGCGSKNNGSLISAGVSSRMGYDNFTGFNQNSGVYASALGVSASVTLVSTDPNEVMKTSVSSPYGLFRYETNFRKNGDHLYKPKDLVKGFTSMATSSIERFNDPGSYSSSMAPINNVSKLYSNLSVGFGGFFCIGVVSVEADAAYFESYNDEASFSKKAIGYMHLDQYDRSNEDYIVDHTSEGGTDFNKNLEFLNHMTDPSYIQKDNFYINAGGLGIGAQMMRDEYGEFSRYRFRYQSRQLYNIANIKTDRKEVYPWPSVNKTVVKKGIDILDLFRKQDDVGDKDLDKFLFEEKELVNMNTTQQKYEHKPVLRMRGDMAGDFNMSSESVGDFDPNEFTIESTSEVGGKRLLLIGYESKMPVYYPQKKQKKNGEYTLPSTAMNIKRGTNIQYKTFAEIEAVTDYATPESSVFTHFELSSPLSSADKNTPFLLSQSGESMANSKSYKSFTPLKKILSGAEYNKVKNLIADITVKKADGMTYLFNLPVLQKSSSTLSIAGKQDVSGIAIKNINKAPIVTGEDYRTYEKQIGGKVKDRNKTIVKQDYWYPYAWLLTAVVGPDYVDYDEIPGPSDGDLGYWVKFKYIKVADDYRWRNPFNGLIHYPGAIENKGDDSYMVTSGQKEIYYLERIESRGYVSKYNYAKRLDGFEAYGGGEDGLYNGKAYNPMTQSGPELSSGEAAYKVGNNSLYAVYKVDLFKKRASATKGASIYNPINVFDVNYFTKLATTEFKYDYSLSGKVPNNINTLLSASSGGIQAKDVPYHIDKTSTAVETGKLTLRKVQQITYDADTPVKIPPYNLEYTYDGASEFNPEFDRDATDGWFSYSSKSKETFSNVAHKNATFSVNSYQHYNELDKNAADLNAKVYALKSVSLPSGGKISVEMEAGGYAKVQNKDAYVMRKIYGIRKLPNKQIELEVDISDLLADGKNFYTATKAGKPYIDYSKDKFYGEIAFLENNVSNPDKSDHVRIRDEVSMVAPVDPNTAVVTNTATRKSQWVKLGTTSDKDPFFQNFMDYMYGSSSFKMNAIKNYLVAGFSNCDNPDLFACPVPGVLTTMYDDKIDGPMELILKQINNMKSLFIGREKFECYVRSCYNLNTTDNELYSGFVDHHSYLRTPVYKEVYTGSRVKSISYSDGFSYSSNVADGKHENVYKTNYYYDSQSDGKGISEGVATIEPLGDQSCVIRPDETVGEGFMPGPKILYAKTTVENGYARPLENETAQSKISRKKGKQVYEYFTPKDQSLDFESNFVASKDPQFKSADGLFAMFGFVAWVRPFKRFPKIMIPYGIIPIIVYWKRNDNYRTHSYAYKDITDIYGTLKKQYSLPSGSSTPADMTQYQFAGLEGISPSVNVVDGSAVSADIDPFVQSVNTKIPGRYDQVWGESYYTKETNINSYLVYMHCKTERNFAYTNMKYTYVPPVMTSVLSQTSEGLKSRVDYDYYDYYTGQPLQTAYTDAKGGLKISREIPAYWKYKNMGPLDMSATNANMLTSGTASYQYLGAVAAANLLDASVSEWSNSSWTVPEALLPSTVAGDLNKTSAYVRRTASELTGIYRGTTSVPGIMNYLNPHIAAGNLYMPTKSYVFETAKNTNGTYSSFTDYKYPLLSNMNPDNATWKLTSEITMYDIFGNVIESKDILGKYSAQYIGYDQEMGTASVSNAKREVAVHEGAENLYHTASVDYLEHPNLELNGAKIVGPTSAQGGTSTSVFNFSSLTSTGAGSHEVVICATISGVTPHVPVVRYNATFSNGATRKLILYYDELKKPYFLTDRMEKYDAFFAFSNVSGGCLWSTKIMLGKAQITTLTKDNTFTHPNFSSTAPTFKYQIMCSMASKTFVLPVLAAAGVAHTGDYCFSTAAGATGLKFSFLKASVPTAEFLRKYTAMVWVHKNSSHTKLVLKTSETHKVEASSLTPYLEAGNWVLLRADLDAPLATDPDNKLEAYVYNAAMSGFSIYDDFRVAPFQASMSATVYDQKFGRVTAILDANNFASFYNYDSRGRLSETKAEVANVGVKTIGKKLYNDQKK